MPPKTRYTTHTIHYIVDLKQTLNELECIMQKLGTLDIEIDINISPEDFIEITEQKLRVLMNQLADDLNADKHNVISNISAQIIMEDDYNCLSKYLSPIRTNLHKEVI